MTSDLDLLRQFARENSQDAFTEIVRRHVNLVYSAALRQVRSPQLAEEIAQSVFCDLARNAEKLNATGGSPVLTAWLYSVTRRTAIDVIRKESRRQLREQIAMEMNDMNATANDWTQIEPMLDDAMAALDETDRAAILLRYFENKNLREVGESLKISDDAAQKRVSRAVERLREFFSKQKITVGASGLVVLISANAIQAAPIGLAATISAAAVLTGTAVHTSTLIAATKTIVMTTLQKTIVIATLIAAVGTGIFEAHQAAQLREQNQILQQQQTPLAGQIRQLQADNESLSNRIADIGGAKKLSEAQFNELLRLRGKVGVMQNQLAAQPAAQPAAPTNAPTNFQVSPAAKAKFAEKLDRLKAALNLSDYQTKTIGDLMDKHVDQWSQVMSNMLSGNLSQDQYNKTVDENKAALDAQIKASLTPDQSAAFDQFNQAETATAADASAKQQLAGIMTIDGMELTQDQQDQIRAAFGQAALQSDTSTTANLSNADAVKQQLEQQLAQHVQLLQGILTPDQLNLYQQHEQADIEQSPVLLKMLITPKSN